MKRTPLTGMLTILAALAASIAVAGCGSSSSPKKTNSTVSPTTTPTTTTGGKHSSKPAY